MAEMRNVSIPVKAELAITTAPGPLGKCAPHLDQAIMDGQPFDLAAIPDAVVLVTVLNQFPIAGGQQVSAPCLLGVCLECRKQQMGTVSKAGLLRG